MASWEQTHVLDRKKFDSVKKNFQLLAAKERLHRCLYIPK